METVKKVVEKRGNGGEDRPKRDLDELPVIEYTLREREKIDSRAGGKRMAVIGKGVLLIGLGSAYFLVSAFFPQLQNGVACIAVFLGAAGCCFLIAALFMWMIYQPPVCEEGCRGMILERYILVEKLKVGFLHFPLKHRFITVRIENSEDVVNDVICTKRDFRRMRCGGSVLVVKSGRLLYAYI